jgi:hypothetical protein
MVYAKTPEYKRGGMVSASAGEEPRAITILEWCKIKSNAPWPIDGPRDATCQVN